VTGLRGVGKTVLLSEFETAAKQERWITGSLELEPRHNNEDAIITALLGLCERTRASISRAYRVRKNARQAVGAARGLAISYQDVQFSFDPLAALSGPGLGEALFLTVDASLRHGHKGFVLLLDEAQVLRDDVSSRAAGQHPLSLVVAAVSALQKAGIPLGLVMCGLPTLTNNLLRARTYTERMFRGELVGSLDPAAARDAFVEPLRDTPVTAHDSLVDMVMKAVAGYPYFIQLWGAELWDAVDQAGVDEFTRPLLRAVQPDIYRRLDIDFYEPRIQSLTPAEQDVLLSSAGCKYPPLEVSELNKVTNKSPGNVNVLLGRLVDAGVIYRLRKGQYEYTAPQFADFLRRRVAEGPAARRYGVPQPSSTQPTLFS
jgi:hypothetical protein